MVGGVTIMQSQKSVQTSELKNTNLVQEKDPWISASHALFPCNVSINLALGVPDPDPPEAPAPSVLLLLLLLL